MVVLLGEKWFGSGARRRAGNIRRHGIALLKEIAGREERYCIRAGYAHRAEIAYFDDTSFSDEYQKEVYVRAAELAKNCDARRIYDVGCGSGYKLLRYLGDYDTVGFDVPKTVEFLKNRYPNRKWLVAEAKMREPDQADVVVCSDVIEHVFDPDALMKFLVSLSRKWIVLSTPDRSRQYSRFSEYQIGPPSTIFHAREWAFSELRRYVSQFMNIHEHIHPHSIHSTQMIVGSVK